MRAPADPRARARLAAALLAATLLPTLAACDLAEVEPPPQLVVQAVLLAEQPFPRIVLTQTVPIDVPFDPVALGVAGATVTITALEDGRTIAYREDGRGAYVPTDPAARVRPGGRYRLEVRVPDELGLLPPGQAATAETLVPGAFEVVRPPPERIVYNPLGPPPTIVVTPSAYPGRQGIYLFAVTALDPRRENLTPTFASFDPEDLDRFATTSSPLLNEANYVRNPDGTLTLEVPWLGFAFYGENVLAAYALDDALYDFLRSRDVQFAPGTLSPGEIPEVLSNVRGGVGVFGSAATRSVRVTLERNPALPAR